MHSFVPQPNSRVVRILKTACLALTCTVFTLVAHGQRISASLQGDIKDPTGAVIVNVDVTARNTDTGLTSHSSTNSQGAFNFPSLAAGTYELTAKAPGFETLRRPGVVLEVDQSASVLLVLKPGSITVTESVSGAAPLLQTQASDIGQVIDGKSIEDLPLNERNPLSLVLLAPGVTGTAGASVNGLGFNVNGGRAGYTDVLLDGVSTVVPSDGSNLLTEIPSVDAIEEFKVQTSNFSAQFGNSGGGIINILFRTGTNSLHGTIYDFIRNSAVDANSYFAKRAGIPLASFKRNQFGFSLGGPVVLPKFYNGRNKTFFFTDYEGLRSNAASQISGTVPTLAERSGDFSADTNLAGMQVSIYDPATTTASKPFIRTQFPNNVIPAARINPVSAAVAKYWPLPNIAGTNGGQANNFFAVAGAPLNIDQYDIKLDELIGYKHQLSLRYSSRNYNQLESQFFPAAIQVANPSGAHILPTRGAQLNYTYVHGPKSLIQFRYGVNHIYSTAATDGVGFDPTQLGLPSYIAQAAVAAGGTGSLTFPTFSPAGYYAIGSGSVLSLGTAGYLVHAFLLNTTLVRGNHTLNVGGEFRILANNVNLVGQSSGNFNFSATLTEGPNAQVASTTTGDGFASFLLGYGGGTVTHYIKTVDTVSHYMAVYVQDDWRATPKLTLNLGLRYDLSRPRTERHNRATWFDPTVPSPLTGYPNIVGGIEYPGVNGNPRTVTNDNDLDFDPRVGFAYHPFGPLAIQGAAGIFFTNNPNQSAQTLSNVGFRTDTTYNGVPDGLDLIGANSLSNPFPAGFIPVTGSALGLVTSTGSSIASPVRNQPAPYLEAWNLGLAYQLPGNWLISAAYVGNSARHLIYNPQINQLPDSDLAMGTQLAQSVPNPLYGQVAVPGVLSGKTVLRRYALSPFPQFTTVTLFNNAGAISNYNSLQTGLRKLYGKDLTLRAFFTLAKSMDDDNRSGTYQDASITPFQDGYSLSVYDQSHVFVGSATWKLPFGRGERFGAKWSKWADTLLGGYQLNGIFTAANGVPLAMAATNVAGIGNPGERPNWNGQRSALSGRVEDRLSKYFATQNYSQPATYTFGNTSRTVSLRAPGSRNLDVSAFKTFSLRENLRLQMRFEAFNAFNTPVFSAPGTNVSNTSFGVITSTSNNPRQLQLGAKILF